MHWATSDTWAQTPSRRKRPRMTASTKHRSTRRVRRWLLAFALPLCANAADDYNLNAAFVTNEMKTGALSFPGPNGGTVCVGYNFTPSTPAALTTAGLIHIDSWALSPYIQGWYYPNSAIVPAIVVNTNSAAVDTGFAITGARQIHMHPGYPSANAAIEPSGWAVLRYTVASNGTYSIKGEFQSLNSGTVNVDVLKNGVSILSSGANEDATPFYEIVALAVGDVIDFVVGSAGYMRTSRPTLRRLPRRSTWTSRSIRPSPPAPARVAAR